ncbi:cadmium-translocating P-type ATPase [Stappia sp. GBMRC 2046]|uniref:Cadmium-translocating P-type ATPase n=1 Tax=Stappia sediminis TaxID=2692190 RepID=A0A7X3LVK9_9HYPH|nr:heavy metal translocating P-type ATPase [Stappia sediminis]MXN65888.1 cadmium-translocating P-type ATPase [Stappia sediminis]
MSVHERDWDSFVSMADDGSMHMDLAVEGVTCAACMVEIERGLSGLPGVTNARLNLTSHRLSVDWSEGETAPQTIIDRLSGLGYAAHPFDPAEVRDRGDAQGRELLRCLAVAGFAAMNIMLLSVSVWSGNATDITVETRDFFHWLSALIALPATAYAGRPFFRSAWSAINARRLNMDVPIVLGVLLALFLSIVQTLQHAEHAYFESAVMLLFFLLIGRYLDHGMRRRTRAFAENIAALKAERAARLLDDGTVREVPLSKVEPGERVLVRAGERVPLDGVVEEGVSEIDQSLVTGETALKAVGAGQTVYAGTLNASGNLTVRVTAASGETLLDEVNRLLETATQAKSAYVRLADRAAGLYAPVVHLAAGLTFAGWLLIGAGWQQSLVVAISVLIITCPCALGLAIPAVQVVASGLLFRSGVLLNSGDAIERLADADTVVFDKTGTLTLAVPELANKDDFPPHVLEEAGRLALSSRHPLAAALAAASGAEHPLADAREEPGSGVSAFDRQGREVRLGSALFCGIDPAMTADRAEAQAGASLIVYRDGGGKCHVFWLQQQLREDARETIDRLKRMGLEIEILSGDRAAPVETAAKALGVTRWKAEQSPKDKISRLEELAREGRTVLMVGDGLNDAPALAAAHVSISPVTAVHISQSASDAVFLGKHLHPIADALHIAGNSKRAMVENLGFSGLYNVIAVPFAVLGFVTPLIAALAMSASSIVVTANALRLRFGQAARGDRG